MPTISNERYWKILGHAKLRKPPRHYDYERELAYLQLGADQAARMGAHEGLARVRAV
jgi:hypothetical protein